MSQRNGSVLHWRRWKALCALACLLGSGQAANASGSIVLETGSPNFSIVDDGDAQDAALVDSLPLDTYVYHPGPKQKHITVKTDRASHDFIFERGTSIDFAIRYRGRLYPQRFAPVEPHIWDGPESFTLPFELGDHHTILVKASINGSPPLRLLFDTGASVSVLNRQGGRTDAVLTGKTGNIDLGPITIRSTPIIPIAYSDSLKADGVLGYNGFLGREVTVDYGRRELRVGKPGHASREGFSSLPISWRGARSLVMVGIDDGLSNRQVPMLFDTGSKFALSLSNRDPLAGRIASLDGTGWSIGGRSDGGRIYSRVFTMPRVTLAGVPVADARAEIELPGGESGLAVNILGNDFLKRFDLILDYGNGTIHVRPNALMPAPFDPVPVSDGVLMACLGALALAVSGGLLWYRSRKGKGASLAS